VRIHLCAAMLALASLVACATTLKPERPTPVTGGMRFSVLAPTATSVALVGSFNGWSPTAHRMASTGSDGLWSLVIPLPQGEHQFMYVINGKTWLVPPLAEDFVTDGFGTKNGIVVVR